MIRILICAIGLTALFSSALKGLTKSNTIMERKGGPSKIVVFAVGCFWCTEAIFSQLKGVEYPATQGEML